MKNKQLSVGEERENEEMKLSQIPHSRMEWNEI